MSMPSVPMTAPGASWRSPDPTRTAGTWAGTTARSDQLRYGPGGARVTGNTLVGTPVYDAGLERGDLIVRLDGRPIRRFGDLRRVLEAHEPGDELALEFVGRSGRRETTVVLAENPNLEVVTYEQAGLPVTREMREFREDWLDGDR